jgi:hypothetical protein
MLLRVNVERSLSHLSFFLLSMMAAFSMHLASSCNVSEALLINRSIDFELNIMAP